MLAILASLLLVSLLNAQRPQRCVPCRAPSNLRLSNVRFDQVKVQWDPLPQQFANGRLLGYTVYFFESFGLYEKSVSTSTPNVSMVILKRLKSATPYQISVAAFTSKGVGTRSLSYITTGCGGSVIALFGILQVGRSVYFRRNHPLQCNWKIGNAGISQAVALVSLTELSLSYSSAYIKVIDGNGITVLSSYEYSSSTLKTFRSVSFGNSGNITVQIYICGRYSNFKLQFAILKQGFQSAFPLANWSVSVDNTTAASIRFSWENLQTLIGQRISHYFVIIKNAYGSTLDSHVASGNTISYGFYGLAAYGEYRLCVVGVNYRGNAYNSTEKTVWTDEGVPSRAPSNIRLSNLQFAEVTVQWERLLQQYATGRLLGYRVFYSEYFSSYYSSVAKTLNTSSSNVTMITLRDVQQAKRYRIAVAAFTSKGVGVRSHWAYITTSCGGSLNQSFGQIKIGRKNSYGYVRCTWSIKNVGIKQAVALVSLQELYLSHYREYVKIIDGKGTVVARYRNSSSPKNTFAEVYFANSETITISIYLYGNYSNGKLEFGILQQEFQTVPNWNVSVDNTTSTTIQISWPNLASLLSHSILHYVTVVRSSNGSIIKGNFKQGNTTSNVFYGLSPHMEYRVSVIGTIDNETVYKTSEVTERTKEGVPSRAPYNIRFSQVTTTHFTVTWSPLPRQFHNGILLGYRIHFRSSSYYSIPFNTSIVDTRSPNITEAVIAGLKPAQRYDVSVVAYTSKGEGQRSSCSYVSTACEMSVNQSFGWLNFTQSNYNTLNCSVQINNAGVIQGVALVSFQYIYLIYCSEYIKIYDNTRNEVYHRRGCDSYSSGQSVEVPFGDGDSITLTVLLYYRYSNARIQYTVLDKALGSAQVMPLWRVTITHKTTASLTVRWTNFPLRSVPIQRFLARYKEQNSNVSLIYQVSRWPSSHYSGKVLRGYQFYEVNIIAVASNSENGPYSSQTRIVRTNEGVPSITPSGLRVSRLQFSELNVQWNPIPQHSANGRLLGYIVSYQEYRYNWNGTKRVKTSSPNVHMLVLRGLKAGHQYRVWVAGFTPVGTGPQSSSFHVTTGCGGYANRSFGHLQIGSNRSSYLTCTFVVGRVGINQAVALVWIRDLYLSNYSEFCKIINGSGSLVWHKSGYSSSGLRSYLQVGFGNADNITVQIHLRTNYSLFKLQYGIVKQGLFSALPVDWNVTVSNTSTTSITFHWQDLAPIIHDTVLYYIAIAHDGNLSSTSLVSGNASYASVLGLAAYTEYQVTVVGINIHGQAYNSSNLTIWTNERVPSRAPSNVRLSRVRFDQVKVQWDPLPQQFANGRLLGYTVYYYEYYISDVTKSVSTSTPYVSMVILKGLKVAINYQISVAAFTSKGVGTPSPSRHIRTGCGGSLNELFGNLQVAPNPYDSLCYNLQCSWKIGNAGISQAVALVSLPELYLSYHSEHLEIIDGNGITVLSRYGYSSVTQKTFHEVSFGNSGNITVQIHLMRIYSNFKLQFGILKQGFQSAFPLANWSLSIGDTNTTSIQFSWQSLQAVLGQQISHYFVVIKNPYGSSLSGHIASANTTSHVFSGLATYMEFRLCVVGVNYRGNAYNSTENTAWTDEGIPGRAPYNITFSEVTSTQFMVTWNPLPRQFHNGRLLGYRVYFWKNAYYSISFTTGSVDTRSPNITRVVIAGLRMAQRYDVSVSAYTCKGEGPRSYPYNITTARCSDKDVVCQQLPTNFCSQKFYWSWRYCRRSCGFCTDTLPTTAAFTPLSTTTAFSTPTMSTLSATLQPSTNTQEPQTPSTEEKSESVMLKIKNMDLNKWNSEMETSFKERIAEAAWEFCTQDKVQCYPSQTNSRRRRSTENVTFTADMVHILPGYPKQSFSSSDEVLLAFYIILQQGFWKRSFVPKDVLCNIVMFDKEKIGKSVGGEITSAEPLPSSLEKLEDKNKESDGKSKPTNVIIGASVGGGLLLVLIAAVLIGYNRFGHRVASQEAMGSRHAANKTSLSTSSKGNVDNMHLLSKL